MCDVHDRDCDGVANEQDCNPDNAAAAVELLFYPDCDGDGRHANVAVPLCDGAVPDATSVCRDEQTPDGGWDSAAGDDCDDEDGDLAALATDSDCDGACDAEPVTQCMAGVLDRANTDRYQCADTDGDGCDDCTRGRYGPQTDGVDTDDDGLCDDGDPDDDNDGVCDGADATADGCVAGPDSGPTDPTVCKDSDADGCDDCSQGSYSPNNDGHDADGDGLCEPWVLQAWGYRKPITVARRSPATTHHDFPVLIDIRDDASLTSHARDDGHDIRFTTRSGEVLHHETTAFDAATGSLLAWVRLTALDTSVDTLLLLYYGNQGATADPSSADAWAGYHAVWHLDEEGSGAQDDYLDSSGNALHAQGGGGDADRIPQHVAGRIGQALKGDGDNDFVSTPVQLQGEPSITVTAWYNINATDNVVRPAILGQNNALEIGFYWPDRLNAWTPGVTTLCPGKDIPSACAEEFWFGAWKHLAVVFDGVTMALYLDGVQKHTVAVGSGSTLSSGFRFNLFGAVFDASGNSLDGMLDEARIAKVARSAAWIAHQYATQSNPAGFYSVGAEEPRR